MNITKDKIEYIKGDKVKTFKIPKEDRNINFKKWSFGDVLQYIKLTKEKNKKSQNSPMTKRSKIKYTRLRTVKDNLIINGKKSVNQLKEEYVLMSNIYGANSQQARSILDQLNEYGEKIITPLYQEYLKVMDPKNPFRLSQNQFCLMLDRKFNELMSNDTNYYWYIKNTKQEIDIGMEKPDNLNVFSRLINKDADNYNLQIRDDIKFYFGFTIKDGNIDGVIDKIKKECEDKEKDFRRFYKWNNKYCKVKTRNINTNEYQKDFQNDGLFPKLLNDTTDYIWICYDLFEYMMSKDNGKLRNKIFYCQYMAEKTYDSFNYKQYVIINNDIIDVGNFIKYFMDDDIEFKGDNLDLAFTNLIISKTLEKCGLNSNMFKNAFDVKENEISGTTIEPDNKMIIDNRDFEEDNEEDIKNELDNIKKERMKKKSEFYTNNKNRNQDYYEWMNKNKTKDDELTFKMSEDNEDEDSEDEIPTSKIDIPKPIKPIITTENKIIPIVPKQPDELKTIKLNDVKPIDPNTLTSTSTDVRGTTLGVPPTEPIKINNMPPVYPPTEPIIPIYNPNNQPIIPILPPVGPSTQPSEFDNTVLEEAVKHIINYDPNHDPLEGLPTYSNLNNKPIMSPIIPPIAPPIYEKDDKVNDDHEIKPTILNDDNSIPVPDELFKNVSKVYAYCYYNKDYYLQLYAIILTDKDNQLIKCVTIDNLEENEEIFKLIFTTIYNYYSETINDFEQNYKLPKEKINKSLKITYKIKIRQIVKQIKEDIKVHITECNGLEEAKNKLNYYLNKKKLDLRGVKYSPEIMARVYFGENETTKGGFEIPTVMGIITYSTYNNNIIKKHSLIKIQDVKIETNYMNKLNDITNEKIKQYENYRKNDQITKIIKENILIKIKLDLGCEVEYIDNGVDKLMEDLTKTKLKPLPITTIGVPKQGDGIIDSIKDFINFRKDVKETEYYLLQRIIKLESEMKNVKNKIVSNDIRTNLNKINYGGNDDDNDNDDWDNTPNVVDGEGNGFNNHFTCSRCGKINPKFFNGNYPTLSEFREQFSKL